MSFSVFSTKVLIEGTIYFYVSYWWRDRHFTWSSEPHEGLAVCSSTSISHSILRPYVLVRPWEWNPRHPALESIANSDWSNPATWDEITSILKVTIHFKNALGSRTQVTNFSENWLWARQGGIKKVKSSYTFTFVLYCPHPFAFSWLIYWIVYASDYQFDFKMI